MEIHSGVSAGSSTKAVSQPGWGVAIGLSIQMDSLVSFNSIWKSEAGNGNRVEFQMSTARSVAKKFLFSVRI